MKSRKGERKKGRKGEFFILFISVFLFLVSSIFGQPIAIKNKLQKNDLPLVYQDQTAEIYVSNDDFKVVKLIANDLGSDVEKVTGKKPSVNFTNDNLPKNIVIIGTLGKSYLLEKLIQSKKLDVSKIENKWESFQIETIRNPFPNVENALVIVGSDRRGTAFGVYQMSQKVGVSPWTWWADVAPEKRENLVISKGKFVSAEPSGRALF